MQNYPLIRFLLLPLSLIYGIVVQIRNKMFDIGLLPSKEFNLPIISIGNITAGGTGKTPMTQYLVELLKDEFIVAVLSRGYKRRSKGFFLADNFSTPESIGDEPYQIKNRYPEIIVAVCNKRVEGVRKILYAHPETEIILLDDAYQHRYIKPGLSILLIDFNNPVTKDFLLPAGLLREPVSEIKRANIVVVTKCPDKLKPIDRRIMIKELDLFPFQHLFFTSVQYGKLLPVYKGNTEADKEQLKKDKAHIILFTGIANPRPLRWFARGISTKIQSLAFPDHHNFTQKDLQKLEEIYDSINEESKLILTTEKDAVRLKSMDYIPEKLKETMYFVPIATYFLYDKSKEFNQHVLNYVRGNKKNSIFVKGKR